MRVKRVSRIQTHCRDPLDQDFSSPAWEIQENYTTGPFFLKTKIEELSCAGVGAPGRIRAGIRGRAARVRGSGIYSLGQ